MPTKVFAAVLFFFAVFPQVYGQSIELAEDLHQHGLTDKAKDTLISILHNSASTPATKSKALYWLGQISFEEGRFTTALTDWNNLVKTYPQTAEAKEISARLLQLKEIVTKVSDKSISSVVAGSYISHGDFWSKADRKFTIDSSWLPETELAVAWYDRAIQEFPQSDGAELAFQRKLQTLLGWKEGREGESHGAIANFAKYMPQVLDSFAQFESSFPNNSSLQAFRYQIAQAYWGHRDWAKTREWLQKIIDQSNGQSTFYTETAKARLAKIEY